MEGKKQKSQRDSIFFGFQKALCTVTAAMTFPWKEIPGKPRQLVKKQRPWLLVQGGRAEGRHSSLPVRAPKLQQAVEPPLTEDAGTQLKKRYLTSKDKEAERDSRRGTTTVKSHPIPAGWVTHRLDNNDTKEVLTLL